MEIDSGELTGYSSIFRADPLNSRFIRNVGNFNHIPKFKLDDSRTELTSNLFVMA